MSNDLKKNIKDNQIVVIVVTRGQYKSSTEKIAYLESCIFKKICYVTLNKSYDTLTKDFESRKIDLDKILFIDSVSGKVDSQKGVIFVSSPKALTELSITIADVLKKDVDSFVFDSISTLLVYVQPETSIKFIHFIISKIRSDNKNCALIALDSDMSTSLMKDVSMFVDKVVDGA